MASLCSVFKNLSARRARILIPSTVRLAKGRHYCTPPDVKTEAMGFGSWLELRHSRWPHDLSLSYSWLRDHCRCHLCYNSFTKQRVYDVCKLPLNIQPAAIKTTQEELELQWPDGHISKYDYKFLWQNSYEGRRTSHKVPYCTWRAATFPPAHMTTIPVGDLYDPKKAGVRRVIYSIVRNGFAIISEVPADTKSTCAAIEKVCAIKKTLFGEFWSFSEASREHADTAYSSGFIGAHTDTTYFSQACRIQVFHCLQPAAEGGENLLVDGFSVAEQFYNRDPKGYNFLSSEAIPSEYIEDGQCHMSLDTIFKHHQVTGQLQQFRYNMYDRAPLSSLPLEKVQEFYIHFQNLTKIIRNPKNEYWLTLEPGNVLFIDNWRVMHGRASYQGERIMSGCYLDNDDFTSKARVLGVQL
ncbi:trimethyllysine dioxygenase, mitochondrial isoform X1 [Panulirus ornatus]|uniref:trimethyllysine dioxygenase, mitochondrial isoform X1 n=3 Tax=Panulirus ornatus TaxID=150431 RepID=UPI003A8632C9